MTMFVLCRLHTHTQRKLVVNIPVYLTNSSIPDSINGEDKNHSKLSAVQWQMTEKYSDKRIFENNTVLFRSCLVKQ